MNDSQLSGRMVAVQAAELSVVRWKRSGGSPSFIEEQRVLYQLLARGECPDGVGIISGDSLILLI